MHRGFNYYYREGLQKSGKTLYRNKCFFRYLLYFLAEFFGRIFIIFNPHFNLAAMRQGYVIRRQNILSFSSSFREIKNLGTYVLTLCFEGLIILAGIAASAVLAVVLGSIGYGVSVVASYENYELFILLFAAPAALVCVLYVLVSFIIFSPTAYIIANNEKVGAGEAIGACYRTMLTNGKMTVFLSYFISCVLKSVYLGAAGAGSYYIVTMLVPSQYSVITAVGLAIAFLAIYLTFAPVLTLANRVVKEHLFEDIVLDTVTAERVSEKVNVSVCNGKKLEAEAVPQSLASLFDYTEDPYRILGEREKKAKYLEDNKKSPKAKTPAVAEEAVKPKKMFTAEPQSATERVTVTAARAQSATSAQPASQQIN